MQMAVFTALRSTFPLGRRVYYPTMKR
ncbi:hypothetical protein BIW11_13079 [Tropilaelaps mercedesae]|uniref:Uncharacterized protein n=1 Tax=Tropilaelaps mercedesae TaxID=418985 RepID=A0A1V9X4J3_9ACAR|nr:hypothetical protein BIW11_13079 [Tropilaelaps mercedesae]